MINLSKGQIYTRANFFCSFCNLMFPKVLCRSPHEQQTSMFEQQFIPMFVVMIMSKMKKPGCSQTHRSDNWVFAEFRFVVCVPPIAVFAIAIQVEQDGSKGSITQLIDSVFNALQGFRHRLGCHHDSRIAIRVQGMGM